MSWPFGGAEVRAQLRAAFAERLEPAGWRMLDAQNRPATLVAMVGSLEGDFAATAEIDCSRAVPDIARQHLTHVWAGVSYEPLRALAPLLGQFAVAVIHEPVWPQRWLDDGEDADEPEPRALRVQVDGPDEVDAAADKLAAVILEHAIPFARRYCDLEALLEHVGGRQQATVPEAAILTAAGRFADARDALDRIPPSRGTGLGLVGRDRRDRRTVYQLRRFLDSGGDPRLIPSALPPSRFARRELSFSRARADAAKRSAAVDAVRRAARGSTRDETRDLLAHELSARGVADNGSEWVEDTLDHLWDTRTEQLQSALGALAGLGRLGHGLIKALRDEEALPDLDLPAWLEPPDHALYEFPASLPRVGVALDDEAFEWLDDVYDAIPMPFANATSSRSLTAWIRSQPAEAPEGTLQVFLGQRRTGTIPAHAAQQYQTLVQDAASRAEHPCMEAVITRRNRPPTYVLDIDRPA